jgi:hypothetical protein
MLTVAPYNGCLPATMTSICVPNHLDRNIFVLLASVLRRIRNHSYVRISTCTTREPGTRIVRCPVTGEGLPRNVNVWRRWKPLVHGPSRILMLLPSEAGSWELRAGRATQWQVRPWGSKSRRRLNMNTHSYSHEEETPESWRSSTSAPYKCRAAKSESRYRTRISMRKCKTASIDWGVTASGSRRPSLELLRLSQVDDAPSNTTTIRASR